MADSPLVVKGTITLLGCLKIAVSRGTLLPKRNLLIRYSDRVHAESCGFILTATRSKAAHEDFQTLPLSLTSQRLLNSLCSIRSSSLVSLLTMVA